MAYKQWHSSSKKHASAQLLISDTILQEKEQGFPRKMDDSGTRAAITQDEPRASFSNKK